MKDSLSRFRGLGVAVITPFLPDGKIDFPALELLIEDLVRKRVDYLVALGTTSESPTLSPEEKRDVVRCVAAVNDGRLPLVMGVGGPNTLGVARDMEASDSLPVDAFLSVAPYYNKPSQEGLFEHFKFLSQHAPRPIILYNVPGRTSCNVDAATTMRIAQECPNVIGIKEASGKMKQIMNLLNHKPENFLVISGDDMITLPLMAVGMDGLISVVANAFPAEMANMVHLAMNDQFIKARLYHDRLFNLMQACFQEGNPSGIKAVLSVQGKLHNRLRLPNVPVTPALYEKIEQLVKH